MALKQRNLHAVGVLEADVMVTPRCEDVGGRCAEADDIIERGVHRWVSGIVVV